MLCVWVRAWSYELNKTLARDCPRWTGRAPDQDSVLTRGKYPPPRVQNTHTMSAPKSKVGTPGYIAPEVIKYKQYDGQVRRLSRVLAALLAAYSSICVLVLHFNTFPVWHTL